MHHDVWWAFICLLTRTRCPNVSFAWLPWSVWLEVLCISCGCNVSALLYLGKKMNVCKWEVGLQPIYQTIWHSDGWGIDMRVEVIACLVCTSDGNFLPRHYFRGICSSGYSTSKEERRLKLLRERSWIGHGARMPGNTSITICRQVTNSISCHSRWYL